MYVYMLPLSPPATAGTSAAAPTRETIVPTPTHDGGLEHTAATFDAPAAWLARARANDIILFPPQFYLLHLVQQQFDLCRNPDDYQAQRDALVRFLQTTPTTTTAAAVPLGGGARGGEGKADATARIAWADKVMSPATILVRKADGRVVLGVDKPGPELRGTGRGGDWDRVVLVNFTKAGPRDVEVRWREEVLREEREGAGAKL